MSVYQKALALATKYHEGQKYSEDRPYMYHLMQVVNSVKSKWGDGNEALLAVAVLHDILEDTVCTEEMLRDIVGKDITKFVVALTKREKEPYDEYMKRVKEFHYSKEVKIHDTLCNLTESIKSDSAYRVRKYANQLHILAQ